MMFVLRVLDRRRAAGVLLAALMAATVSSGAFARGPVRFEGEEAVSIYRDFDDGLYGRSLYRGVLFSMKLSAFDRYRSLPVQDLDGLTAYLLSGDAARRLAAGNGWRTARLGLSPQPESAAMDDADPRKWTYRFDRNGIVLEFALEDAPEGIFAEIRRTYPNDPAVTEEVADSYRAGYVIRILVAENVFRPEFARIDYEDVLVAASLLGDDFQPLWGIHDGNNLTSPR